MIFLTYSTKSLHPSAIPISLNHVAPKTLTTPYGFCTYQSYQGVYWVEPAKPHTLVYAAKELGATHIIEIAPMYALNRLLIPGDFLIPQDMLDLTQGRVSTFFVGKGYGFVQQHPPYCPYLRSLLIEASYHAITPLPLATRPRVFKRGTYAGVEPSTLPPHHQQARRMWGADAIGQFGLPTSSLARELELCYALLGYMLDPTAILSHPLGLAEIVLAIVQRAASIPTNLERSCVCATAMQAPRQRGLIGDDWHTWIG